MKTAGHFAFWVLTCSWTMAFVAGPSRAEARLPRPAQNPTDAKAPTDNSQADAYYYFTMGHLQEQQYEITNNADSVNEAVDDYKKALDLNPGSPTIMERLAEVYAKSQRVREAVAEAQQVLKIDPNDVAARRLLARIYVRTLGDPSGGAIQQEQIDKL